MKNENIEIKDHFKMRKGGRGFFASFFIFSPNFFPSFSFLIRILFFSNNGHLINLEFLQRAFK
jgi:hypothetical protein